MTKLGLAIDLSFPTDCTIDVKFSTNVTIFSRSIIIFSGIFCTFYHISFYFVYLQYYLYIHLPKDIGNP